MTRKKKMLKPEVEDIKPLSPFSKSVKHSKSLIEGHTPGAQDVSSYSDYISLAPDCLAILVVKESAGEVKHVRVNNCLPQLGIIRARLLRPVAEHHL